MSTSLGSLETAVLAAIVRLGSGAYGASVRREVSERSKRDYSIGAIYTTLERLEEKGLLQSWMSEPTAQRGGRSRRCFALTGAGEQALRDTREHFAWTLGTIDTGLAHQ